MINNSFEVNSFQLFTLLSNVTFGDSGVHPFGVLFGTWQHSEPVPQMEQSFTWLDCTLSHRAI